MTGSAISSDPLGFLTLGRPSKVVCVGLNYVDHAAESGMSVPERPLLFAKWPSALIGPGEPIVIPEGIDQVDYEAELAVVIGKRGTSVAVERALDHVAGFLCLNDVSARGVQLSDGQWTRGKSFDTFSPVGPRIVSRREIGDPQNLSISCRVNGDTVQDASTADMVFTVAEIIAFASQSTTLEPGDIISTGTPPGVALGRSDRRYLQAGDRVEVEIEGIGVLENVVTIERNRNSTRLGEHPGMDLRPVTNPHSELTRRTNDFEPPR